jgi:hypothetical protein
MSIRYLTEYYCVHSDEILEQGLAGRGSATGDQHSGN